MSPADPFLAHVTSEVVALTILDGALCALVTRRAVPPFPGRWALPGSSLERDTDLDTAARVALGRASGTDCSAVRLEQLAVYGAPRRDPRHRAVCVAWLAVLPGVDGAVVGLGDGAKAAWRPADRLLERGRLAFDHRQVLSDGVERVRARLEYSNLATAFLEGEFTIADLRSVYEVVWGRELDAGNFHRKVTRTEGFVRATGRRRTIGRGRPAELFGTGGDPVLHPPLARRSLG